MGQGPADREALAGIVEDDPALEHGAEPVDDGGIEVREVGDGLVADAPSLSPCPSEKDGPGSVLVRDHVDSDGHSFYVSASCLWIHQLMPFMGAVKGHLM